jgi:hypothetical protein
MARRRTLNYREMRADFDEDEDRQDDEEGDEDEEDEDEEDGEGEEEAADGEESEEEGDDEDAPVKKKAKPKPKPKPKRTRAVKITRKRVVWCVFNNSHQEVATYEYAQKADAEAHAARLMADKKTTHFVNPVKKDIVEEKEKKEK